MSAAPLEIRLLGPLEVERSGRALDLPPSRKARALLAYLATTGRAHGRGELCDLLWDGPADPRAALRGALSKLRPLVDDSATTRLITDGVRVALEPHDARIDVVTVRNVAADMNGATVEMLTDAAARFRGEFLEGLDLSRCYRFDAWCTAERENVRQLRVSILSSLVARLADDPAAALRHARERLQLDPLEEAAHRDVMRLLGEMGRTREAREQYERCRAILDSELGARPSPTLEALRRAILPARTSFSSGSPPSTPAASTADHRGQPPLVGRERERQLLREVIDTARSGGGEPMLLLIGEPGIGKSRLLDELRAMTIEIGGDVLTGRAFEAEMVRPYGAWIDALRAIPREEIPPALRPELAPLLPELGAAQPNAADRNRLFEAVARLLVSRATIRRPTVIVLDDLQWMDEASTALLHFIARCHAGQGVLLACSSRRVDLADNPAAARLLRAVHREGALREMAIAPLDADATARLVNGVGPMPNVGRVFARSGGNPLFALELAHADRGEDDSLPDTIDELIADRLTRLDPLARTLLPWAAAMGHDFDLGTLERIAELSTSELLTAVEELERRNVLRAAGDRYDFTHDIVREVAYRRISEPRRRLIHGRIARVLDDGDHADHELAGEVAHHAALGGESELAARSCLAAARRALWAFAPEEAAVLVAHGLRHIDELRQEIRLALHLELLGLSVYPGMREHRLPNIEERLSRIVSEARAAGLQAQVHRGFQLIADLHFLDGDFGGALDRSLRAQEAGRAADPATVVRAIGDTARCLGIIEHDMRRAEKLAREAEALAEGTGYEGHELPQALGYVHHHRGELDEAVACFERAAARARTEHARWFECACLSRLVMIELERGRAREALERCRELLAVTSKLDEGSDAPFAEALEALARLRLGDDDATARLDRAVAGLRQADSRWMVAYVQNLASQLDLDAARIDAARARAEEALEAATIVKRPNEIAVARSLMARAALAADDRAGAISQLDALRSIPGDYALSRRAREAAHAAGQSLCAVPP